MGTRQSIIKPNNLEVIVESSKEKKDPQISISDTSSSSSSRSRSPANLQVEDTKKNLDLEAAGLHPALLAQLQAATANKNLKRRASIANLN